MERMETLYDIAIRPERRSCTVNDELGYFHCWEHFSQPIGASPFVGGAPAGVVSKVYGIVEFADGVRHVEPSTIKFRDETNAYLQAMKKHKEAEENG